MAMKGSALALMVVLLSGLQVACSATSKLASDPYEGCIALGYLEIWSDTGADAERNMRARVLELGGDTLLLGSPGISIGEKDVPELIVERRNQLLAAGQVSESDNSTASRDQVQTLPGEGRLRYDGAALRCNQ